MINKEKFVMNAFGKFVNSEAYNCWNNMMHRCKNGHGRVCEEWKDFGNFYRWYRLRHYPGAELDKDWKGYHCRYYCPENCVFMPKALNEMLRDKCIGEYEFPYINGKYVATCSLGGRQEYIGRFTELEDCVNAVIKAKRSYALGIADGLKMENTLTGEIRISDEAYNAVLNYKWA